jgi:hypothetical protein
MSSLRGRAAQVFGGLAGGAVKLVDQAKNLPERWLDGAERALLDRIYERSVDLGRVRVKEGVTGVLGASKRAFVVGDVIYLPRDFVPLREDVLVHEICHVWQYQNGGSLYIADSIWGQLFGDGYDFEKGIREGTPWHRLNAEQQASLVECAYLSGYFESGRFRVGRRDYTPYFDRALGQLREGKGAN